MKLENIFLAADGSVRVGDFGLTMSKMQELAISPVGTVEYMAPEASPHTHLSMQSVCYAGLGHRVPAMHSPPHAAVPGKHYEPEHAGDLGHSRRRCLCCSRVANDVGFGVNPEP